MLSIHYFDKVVFIPDLISYYLNDVYIHELDFAIKSWNNTISSMDNLIIDRVCESILPSINNKIIELIVEPNTIARLLSASDYPKVSSLSLMSFPKNILIQHLKTSRIQQLLNKQITHLTVHTINEIVNDDDLLELIVSVSKYLVEITYHQSEQFEDRNLTISQFSSTICFSLQKLDIQLNTFEESLFIFKRYLY